jgi:hypothetical protein
VPPRAPLPIRHGLATLFLAVTESGYGLLVGPQAGRPFLAFDLNSIETPHPEVAPVPDARDNAGRGRSRGGLGNED